MLACYTAWHRDGTFLGLRNAELWILFARLDICICIRLVEQLRPQLLGVVYGKLPNDDADFWAISVLGVMLLAVFPGEVKCTDIGDATLTAVQRIIMA